MIRKNKKFIDPRYFMDEKMETIKEVVTINASTPTRPTSATTRAVPKLQEDNSPPEVDIADAIQMLESEEDVSGTLFQVINRLQVALEKLGGQEEPRDPYADESPYDAGY
jgi:uncharacterized protein (UPF0147 family)